MNKKLMILSMLVIAAFVVAGCGTKTGKVIEGLQEGEAQAAMDECLEQANCADLQLAHTACLAGDFDEEPEEHEAPLGDDGAHAPDGAMGDEMPAMDDNMENNMNGAVVFEAEDCESILDEYNACVASCEEEVGAAAMGDGMMVDDGQHDGAMDDREIDNPADVEPEADPEPEYEGGEAENQEAPLGDDGANRPDGAEDGNQQGGDDGANQPNGGGY
ncbi:MAG: hypothetical protein CMH61_01170 [Nanoarchaeota archaeon]|nr:hypothetical protein [Nanoarchaeota archaeon]